MNLIYWDLETADMVDFDDLSTSEISYACALVDGEIRVYDLHNFDLLAREIEGADLSVTYNGLRFDNEVLQAALPSRIQWPEHCDLHYLITRAREGRRVNLDVLCRATIGRGKNGHGKDAPALYREGRIAELITYCISDVMLLPDLYQHIKTRGYIVDPYTLKAIPVEVPGGVPALQPPQVSHKDRYNGITDKQVSFIRWLRNNRDWNPTDGMTSRQASDMIDTLRSTAP